MKTASSIFFGIWSILFTISAYLQINDPDPFIWVSIYLIAAVMSALAAMHRYPLIPLVLIAVLCLIGSIYYFPPSVSDWIAQEWQQQDLTMKTASMEESRESLGLLLIAVVTGVAIYLGWRKKKEMSDEL